MQEFLIIEQSLRLSGTAELVGAKNAVLVIMASLILTEGRSVLTNVPASHDVHQMIALLQELGAYVTFDANEHILQVDTSKISSYKISPEIMNKMRASVLAMGPLLARFGRAELAMPGGCVIGARPIDYHLTNFQKMGVTIDQSTDVLIAQCRQLQARRLVLDYPSVGATENILMAATLTEGTTHIINAALEPEVYDLIDVLRKMGAQIEITQPASIIITGVKKLQPVNHAIIPDRLEAGSLLLAAAITGGEINLPTARADHLDIVLYKLEQMGHAITVGNNGQGIALRATQEPQAVSFKTIPYPGFPTDLQAPMMAAQCVAHGTAVIEETVFENRLLHVAELQKMGAHITLHNNKAIVTGVKKLQGTSVTATDIRASCALVLAGLVAEGTTIMSGIHHWKRGYDALDKKLERLGGSLEFKSLEEKSISSFVNAGRGIKSIEK